jgi:hypothetical protein
MGSAMSSRTRCSLAALLKERHEPLSIGTPGCTTVAWRALLSRLQEDILTLLDFWVKDLRDTGNGHRRLVSGLRRAQCTIHHVGHHDRHAITLGGWYAAERADDPEQLRIVWRPLLTETRQHRGAQRQRTGFIRVQRPLDGP